MDTSNLRIESPCPMLSQRMEKDGENFFCQSCSKTVIDFRGKNEAYLKENLGPSTCGMFYQEQLPAQKKLPLFRKTLFYGLVCLSFLGVSVKPLSAQSILKEDTLEYSKSLIEIQHTPKEVSTSPKASTGKPKKRKLFRRKKRKTIAGCPAF